MVRGGGVDETIVCVRDTRAGAYFEIAAEPYLALDGSDHPFAYRNFDLPVEVRRVLPRARGRTYARDG